MKIKKSDKVQVLLGKDRGKIGTVERVLAKKGQVLIGGVNLYKRHTKPQSGNESTGGIIEKIRPLAASKVALICPKCGKITRRRICQNCKTEI